MIATTKQLINASLPNSEIVQNAVGNNSEFAPLSSRVGVNSERSRSRPARRHKSRLNQSSKSDEEANNGDIKEYLWTPSDLTPNQVGVPYSFLND